MPGRKYSANGSYRYGFNGKEKSDEFATDDYDFGARIYDARIVMWLSVDPMQFKYPSKSPYLYALGNPIFFIDPSGGSVEPSNLVIIKERGTNKFRVIGDITIKLQVLNLSSKSNKDLYIDTYVSNVKGALYNLLNQQATETVMTDIDLKLGDKGKSSNKGVRTGKYEDQQWTFDFKVNIQVEIIDSKDKIKSDAHVLAIVDSYDPTPAEDIEGKPIITPIGKSNGNRVATVSVADIADMKVNSYVQTALHEIAHSFGVRHFWNKKPGDKGTPNLMDYKNRNNSLNSNQLFFEVWLNNGLSPYQILEMLNRTKTPWSEEKQKFSTTTKKELDDFLNNGGANVTKPN